MTRSLLVLVLILLSAVFVDLAAPAVTRPALKAAFLFNFGKFVEWPVDLSPAGPLCVCVLDDGAVEDGLAHVIGGAPATGKSGTLDKDASHKSLRGCHVLYLGDPGSTRIGATLDDLKSAPILTVGDGDEVARGGGMIGLLVEDRRMRFAVNPDAAQRAGLRLSSRLLSLAQIVREGRHGQS